MLGSGVRDASADAMICTPSPFQTPTQLYVVPRSIPIAVEVPGLDSQYAGVVSGNRPRNPKKEEGHGAFSSRFWLVRGVKGSKRNGTAIVAAAARPAAPTPRRDHIATGDSFSTMAAASSEADGVPEGMRAAALTQAATFLSNDSVQKSTDAKGKMNFLLQKGVTVVEIEEAFRRAGLDMPPSEAAAAPPAPTGEDGSGKQEHPYSNKFFAVLQAVQKGETLPGIKEVDDSAREDVTVHHKGEKPRPLKPWEKKKQAAAAEGSVFERKREETKTATAAAAADPIGASKLQSVPKVDVAAPTSQPFVPNELEKWDSTDLKVARAV